MRRHLLTPLFALLLFLGFAAVGEACLFKWLFKHHKRHHVGFAPQTAFFGPPVCGLPAGPAMPPMAPMQQTFFGPADVCGAVAPPVQTFYGPTQTFYAPAQTFAASPPIQQQTYFAPSDVCAVPGNGPATFGNAAPLPGNNGVPRTFEYDPGAAPLPDDNGFRQRAPGEIEDDMDEFGDGRASNPSRAPESIIRQKQPAPASLSPEEGTGAENPSRLQFPPVNLDEKITWRSGPERTRLAVQASYSSPSVARARIEPNRGWTPAKGSGAQVVSK